jgi:hypothetical protein
MFFGNLFQNSQTEWLHFFLELRVSKFRRDDQLGLSSLVHGRSQTRIGKPQQVRRQEIRKILSKKVQTFLKIIFDKKSIVFARFCNLNIGIKDV